MKASRHVHGDVTKLLKPANETKKKLCMAAVMANGTYAAMKTILTIASTQSDPVQRYKPGL